MRPNVVRLLALILFVAVAPGLPDARPAMAGTNTWTSSGPFGGETQALVIDRTTPSTLYAGTPFGIFRTTNSGSTWSAVHEGLDDPFDRDVTALAINQSNGAIFAGTDFRGVFTSTNGGRSWTPVNNGLASLRIRTLATFDATTNNLIYAGTDSGVFRSDDNGATWRGVNAGLTVASIRVVKFSPTDANTLYAGTDDGVFKSIDGATSWDVVNTGLGTPTVNDLDFAAGSSSKIYAATDAGLFVTPSGGERWGAAGTGITSTRLRSVAAHPTDSTIAYAGASNDFSSDTGGVFKTTNGGTSWTPLASGLPTEPGVRALKVPPTSPTTVYAGLDDLGVFKTTDGGASWNDVNIGLNAASISSLARHPSNANVLYAASPSSGMFKSIDGGATWTSVNNGLPLRGANDVVISPGNGNHLFVRLIADRVFRSIDGGTNWTEASSGLPGAINSAGVLRSLAIHPTSGSALTQTTLLAGSNSQGAFKSTNGGSTWSPSNAGIETQSVQVFAIHPSAPNTVFAGLFSTPKVVKSTDGGATWSPSDTGLSGNTPRTLAFQPNNSNVIYAGLLNQDLAKSIDAGATWATANSGLPDGTSVEVIAVHPTRPNTVYAGLVGIGGNNPFPDGGVYKSIDGGATWRPLNTGLDLPQVDALLVVARSDRTTVYAGTRGRSVFSIDQALFTLTVTRAGSGSGTVTSSPAGITCGGDCTEAYEVGDVVTLTANPASGSRFAGWSGACTNATGTCQVSMDAAKAVTATFVPTFTLTVNKAGSGTGTVTSTPSGIDCGSDCNEGYDGGTVVTLTATPTGGSVFAGWSGSGCSGTGTCQVTMSAARTVTATFNGVTCSPRPRVDVQAANNGDGRLRVTITAVTQPPGAPNRLGELRFEAAPNGNAVIDVAGQVGRSGTFDVPLPDRPESVTFFVRRAGPGAAQVPLLVVDGCNPPWRTFVGAGTGVPL